MADEYLSNGAAEVVAQRILSRLQQGPASFGELLAGLADAEYRDILRAWGRLREQIPFQRDEDGRYLLPGSSATAVLDQPMGTAPSDAM